MDSNRFFDIYFTYKLARHFFWLKKKGWIDMVMNAINNFIKSGEAKYHNTIHFKVQAVWFLWTTGRDGL